MFELEKCECSNIGEIFRCPKHLSEHKQAHVSVPFGLLKFRDHIERLLYTQDFAKWECNFWSVYSHTKMSKHWCAIKARARNAGTFATYVRSCSQNFQKRAIFIISLSYKYNH